MLEETLLCRDSSHLKYKILHFKYFVASKKFLQLMDFFKEKPQRQLGWKDIFCERGMCCVMHSLVPRESNSGPSQWLCLVWDRIYLPFITGRSEFSDVGDWSVWVELCLASLWDGLVLMWKSGTGQFNWTLSQHRHFEDPSASPGLLPCQTVFTTGFVFQFSLPFGW